MIAVAPLTGAAQSTTHDPRGFDAHPVATMTLDADARILTANVAAQDLIGSAARALIGKPFAAIAPDFADRRFPPEHTLRAFDVALAVPVGALTVDIVADTDAAARTILALLSARVTSATHAATAQPASSGAAAILAHEIKNPLSGIRGAAQLIAGGASDPARFTDLICREVDRIAALIDRMEALASTHPPDLADASIFPAIRQAIDIARAGFAVDIAIEERHDPSLPTARIDHDTIVQILINLIKNAAEAVAGRDDASIRVTTGYRHGYLTGRSPDGDRREAPIAITVSDNGPGVPAHILPDLFRPFASARSGGTGLGLALVDRMARNMGGGIQYERDAKNGLTHFRLMLARGR